MAPKVKPLLFGQDGLVVGLASSEQMIEDAGELVCGRGHGWAPGLVRIRR